MTTAVTKEQKDLLSLIADGEHDTITLAFLMQTTPQGIAKRLINLSAKNLVYRAGDCREAYLTEAGRRLANG